MYNPFVSKRHPVNSFANHFFNNSIADFVGSDFVSSQPSVNIIETESAFRIELTAPGFEKKDFLINIENNQLKVSIDKEKEAVKKSEKFTRREFAYASFQRSFRLNKTVDNKNISAAYKNGILTISLTKKEVEKAELKRKIEIS